MRALATKLLVDETEARLEGLVRLREAPLRRVVRAGALSRNPVHVHGFPRDGRSSRFQPTIDATAALLTQLPAELCQKAGLTNVVLSPTLVATSRFLLTHIFLPRSGILACYLYPGEWNSPRTISGPRRGVGQTLARPGLFQAVLEACATGQPLLDSQQFVIPLHFLEPSDLSAMEAVAEAAHRR